MTRTISSAFSLVLFASFVFGLAGNASAQQKLSSEQKQEVETIVKEYLLNNPEIIVDSIRTLRIRDEMAAAKQRKDALTSMQDQLINDPNDPVMGNPHGDVTVVEFFDYRCGYCKKVFPDIQRLLKEDGNIRLILKEWPILGDDSTYASRAALSVWFNQSDKYSAFHTAMMENKGALSNARVLEHAKAVGVDVDKMKLGLGDIRINQAVANSNKLAGALGITGTPAFVFGSDLVPGAIDFATMKELVTKQRKAK